MADQLTAKFRLAVEDGLSSPIERIEGLFKQLDATLGQLGKSSGLEKVEASISKATASIDKLSATIERATAASKAAATSSEAATQAITAGFNGATAAVDKMAATMAGAAEAAARAASAGERVGVAVAEGADQGTAALDRMQTMLRAISAEDIRRAVNLASAPMSPIDGGPAPRFSAGQYGRDVVHGVRGLGEATEAGVGKAFGAAAAGFGLIEPLHAAAEFDNTIRHIAIGLGLAGKAGDGFVADFGRQMDQLARATGQTGEALADAAGFFSREGYSLARINSVLPTVARISTAYNADPAAVAKTTFALQENMGIDSKGLPGTLAAIALAGKQADLPFEKLAPLFPQVAAQAGALGVHGRDGVNDLAAALAVMRKNTGTEGEATTDARAFMQAITSPHTAKRFAKFGVDLFGVIGNANKQGKDPIEAVLAKVDAITHRGTDMKAMGTLFNNEQDRGFANALLKHLDQYMEIRAKLAKADPKMLDQDFDDGSKSLKIQSGSFSEELEQLNRRVGRAFAPIVAVITSGLRRINDAFDWLDKHVPGATTAILGTVGGMLALAAVLGAIGAVLPPVLAGVRLIMVVFRPLALLAPLFEGITLATVGLAAGILAVAAVFVAAGVDIYRHWDRFRPFFQELGSGVIAVFSGLIAFVADVFMGRWSRIPEALGHAWGGLKQVFGGLWGILKGLFNDFLGWVTSWAGNLPSRILAGITGAWAALVSGFHALVADLMQPLTDFETAIANSWLAKHLGSPSAAPALAVAGGGGAAPALPHPPNVVHVTLDSGLKAKQTAGTPGAVQIQSNRGQMVGRP